MQIDELQKLIKHSTAVLVLDNGQPSFVIVGYDAYKNLVADKNNEEKEVKIHPVGQNSSASNKSNHMDHREVNGGTLNQGQVLPEKESEILDRLNKEILALKQQIEAEEKGIAGFGRVDVD